MLYAGALDPTYWFVLGGRGTGLSTLARSLPSNAAIHLPAATAPSSIGVYDPGRDTPLSEIQRTVLAMLRFDTRICRDYAPGYAPKIFLTEDQFHALRVPLGFITVDRVYRLQAPSPTAIATELYGTSEPPHGRAVKLCCDSRNRPIWEVLKSIEPFLHSPHALTRDRVGDAFAAWVRKQSDFWPYVAALAAERDTMPLHVLYTKIAKYLTLDESPGDFVERCTQAGILRYGNSKTAVWAPVWHAGARRLGSTIPLDELRAAMQGILL